MELSYKEIKYRTRETNIFYNNKQLIELLESTKQKYVCFLDKILLNSNYSGYEKSLIECHNPLLWEAAHPIFFIEKNCVRYLYPEDNYPIQPNKFNNNLYDSFVIPNEFRNKTKLTSYMDIKKYYSKLQTKIIIFLKNTHEDKIDPTQYYTIMIVILHIHMHLESFIFTNQLVYKQYPFSSILKIEETIITPIKLEMITIPKGNFWQGYFDKNPKIGFDNEKDCFKIKVDSFSISKTFITNYMFLQFIEGDGYKKNEYWSFSGKLWKDNNLLNFYPLYWQKSNGEWYINYFDKLISLKYLYNYPIIHISWYEAEAYCKWAGGRLITETEWEYIATNSSETLYPWSDSEDLLSKCNINYNNKWICSVVNNNPQTNNKWGIEQLIGNCWEWCKDSIYPYNGFKIDPLYREMSYPFFGFKKICRGASWCVPDCLITTSYRNAQEPDTRKQYIGFRLAKD
jgi:gamma-glutamyl hercynylcysteine S-oxide synthase